ncbi:unnamed protein product [Lampetra planeri]
MAAVAVSSSSLSACVFTSRAAVVPYRRSRPEPTASLSPPSHEMGLSLGGKTVYKAGQGLPGRASRGAGRGRPSRPWVIEEPGRRLQFLPARCTTADSGTSAAIHYGGEKLTTMPDHNCFPSNELPHLKPEWPEVSVAGTAEDAAAAAVCVDDDDDDDGRVDELLRSLDSRNTMDCEQSSQAPHSPHGAPRLGAAGADCSVDLRLQSDASCSRQAPCLPVLHPHGCPATHTHRATRSTSCACAAVDGVGVTPRRASAATFLAFPNSLAKGLGAYSLARGAAAAEVHCNTLCRAAARGPVSNRLEPGSALGIALGIELGIGDDDWAVMDRGCKERPGTDGRSSKVDGKVDGKVDSKVDGKRHDRALPSLGSTRANA